MIPFLPHAGPLELIWVLVAIFSLAFSFLSVRDALIDAAVLAESGFNGPRLLVAENNIRQEIIRLCVSVVMIVAAVLFLFFDPPPPSLMDRPQQLIGLTAWVTVAMLVGVASFLDRSIRRKLYTYDK